MPRKFLSSLTVTNGLLQAALFNLLVADDLPFSGVAAGGYTLPNVIVDQYGRVTSATSNTVGTGLSLAGSVLKLADTAVAPGTYTFATVQVDQQGRIIAASSGVVPSSYDALSSLVNSPVAISGSSALTASTWNVVTASAAINLTLPAPTAGSLVGVRIASASTNTATLLPHVAELIDGGISRVMWAKEKAILLADGTNWFKVAGVTRPMDCTLYMLHGGLVFAVANNVVTKIPLDTTAFDSTGLMATLGSNQITVKRTANYASSGMVAWSALSGIVQLLYVQANQNGTAYIATEGYGPAGADTTESFSQTITASAGDLFDLYGYQNSGVSQNVNFGIVRTYLSLSEHPDW